VLYSLQTTEGNSVTRAGIASSEMSTTFAAPFSRNGELQTDTALAVVNPSTLETTTVRLVLRDSAGTTLAEDSFELGPMAHRAFFLADEAELPDTLEGTLQIDSDRPVAPTLLLTSDRLHAASLPVGR
jgi:hypothetical protein